MIRDLVPSISIDNLLAQRDAIAERLRQAAALFGECDELLKAALGEDTLSGPALHCRRSHVAFPESVETMIKHVDAAFWDKLMAESGLRTFMDAAMREKWRKDIYAAEVPELTLENIEATFRDLFAGRRLMFERGVVACFQRLSWDYKTNNPVMFGKRIILRYVVDGYPFKGKFEVSGPSQAGCDKLDDLIRVMSVLDGKPEPDHRRASYAQLREQIGIGRMPQGAIELEGMISIRVYRNGNGHVTFLRPELVDQLNAIVAKHYPSALPPAREVVS